MTKKQNSLLDFFLDNKQLQHRKGDIILSPYETNLNIFYLEEGHVKHYALTENGEEKCYIFYKPGQLFYSSSKTNLPEKDNFFAAMTNVLVRKINLGDLKEFLEQNPKEISQFVDTFFDTLNIFINRVDNLEITDVHTRVITRILTLAHRFGEKNGKKTIINIPITHKDIASTINTTRETVSREMSILEKKKILSCNGHQITCYSLENLQNELKKY